MARAKSLDAVVADLVAEAYAEGHKEGMIEERRAARARRLARQYRYAQVIQANITPERLGIAGES